MASRSITDLPAADSPVMKIISPRSNLKLKSDRMGFSSKLKQTLRNSSAGVCLVSISISVSVSLTVCPSSGSAAPYHFDRAMCPRGHRGGRATQQEFLHPVGQTGCAHEDAVGAPFFSQLDQDMFRI